MRSTDLPPPRPGEVIRYAFLWSRERDEGREEASKDRPCAVVLTLKPDDGDTIVLVLPITTRPPRLANSAVEIPIATRRRLGLQEDRCWIVLTDINRFIWPGPDVRPVETPHGRAWSYGLLSASLFRTVRDRVLARARQRGVRAVTRTP